MRHYECVRQDGAKDCGICCLLTIIRTYKGEVSKEYLRMLTRTGKNGVNAYFLAEAGRQLGFSVQGVSGDFQTLKATMLPCIAHIIVNQTAPHFVVIHEINREKEYLIVADPALGIRTISFTEFERISTKKYLLFTLTKPLLQGKKEEPLQKVVKQIFGAYRSPLFLFFFLSLVSIVLQVVTAFSSSLFLREGIGLYSYQNLWFLFLFFLLITIFMELFQYLRKRIALRLCKEINLGLFRKVISHLFLLPYLYFKSRTTGEVIARIRDLEQLEEGIASLLLSFFFSLFSFLIALIVLFFLSKELAFFLLCVIIILGVLAYISHFFLSSHMEQWSRFGGIYSSFLTESISGISTVQNLQMELSTIEKLDQKYRSFLFAKEQIQHFLCAEQGIQGVMEKGSLFFLLFLGGKMVLDGSLAVGSFLASYSLAGTLLSSFLQLLLFYEEYQSMKVSFRRLDDLLTCPVESKELDTKYDQRNWETGILVKNLTYAYSPGRFILRNFSCEIEKGDKILCYGPSGSGKSTLAKLLLRYLEVPSKKIYINGKDITDVSILSLRQQISYLSQEELLFTDSVYQNVMLYRDFSYDAFLSVAKATRLDFMKEKSTLGYDLLVEENGFNFSGGERQRILLARALLKPAELYIFDESFSEIDVKTERMILKDIFSLFPKKTFLIISHRLSNQDLYQKKLCFHKEVVS